MDKQNLRDKKITFAIIVIFGIFAVIFIGTGGYYYKLSTLAVAPQNADVYGPNPGYNFNLGNLSNLLGLLPSTFASFSLVTIVTGFILVVLIAAIIHGVRN